MTALDISKQRLARAKDKSLVDILSKEGYKLQDTGSYYRCLSPLRIEGKGSFDINKKTGKWNDRGTGKKGDTVDFVMEYNHLTFNEAIDFLLGEQSLDIKIYTPEIPDHDATDVISVEQLSNPRLLDYIVNTRKINKDIAVKWLSQALIRFPNGKNPNRIYQVVAFRNDSGGYEFRNSFLKVGNLPKNITTVISGNDGAIMIFEGFPDFLSYLTYYKIDSPPHPSIILNSTSFLGAIIPMLQGKVCIYWGQNDKAGQKCFRRLRDEGITVIDKRFVFKGYKDMNKFLVESSQKKLSKILV